MKCEVRARPSPHRAMHAVSLPRSIRVTAAPRARRSHAKASVASVARAASDAPASVDKRARASTFALKTWSALPHAQRVQRAAVARASARDADDASVASSASRGISVGALVLALGVAMLLASADRTIFAAAALSIKAELGMSMRDVATAQSAFLWGYGATQLVAGAASDRFGGARTLLGGLFCWSLAVASTPLSALANAPTMALVASRFLFGAASGCALPASAAAVAAHVPAERRSGALSAIFAMFNCGSAFGLAAAGGLIATYGWQAIFYSFGAFGAVWAVGAWASMPADVKAWRGPATSSKAEIVDENGEPMTELSSEIATQLLALLWCHVVVNWGFMILQSWLPIYLANDLGMSIASSGVVGALPWIFTAFMSFSSGQVADRLISGGMERWKVRRLAMNIATIGPALGLFALKFTSVPSVALVCMVATLGLQAVAVAGYHSYLQDVAPSRAGAILGFTNTVGVGASIVANMVTGASVEATGSFAETFMLAASLYLSSCLVWNYFLKGQTLFP